LNEIQAQLQSRHINYWRDKRGHEIDFVIAQRNKPPLAIECKWSASDFDPSAVKSFRGRYIQGKNYVVATDVTRTYRRNYGEIEVTFLNLKELIGILTNAQGGRP
jgi:hypothetical protein